MNDLSRSSFFDCKQRNLDLFIHMLKSISEKRPFIIQALPNAQIAVNTVSRSKIGTKENAIEIKEDDDDDFM